MTVAIIDYGSGNLRSAAKAFEKASQGKKILITNKPKDLSAASHIVLPGVGAFADCMNGLSSISGMVDELKEQVLIKKKKFLGICVGMQLLAERGYEHRITEGLGWIKGEVKKIEPMGGLKVPHMGWNELKIKNDSRLFKGIPDGTDLYFVHSYHMICSDEKNVLAETEYGGRVTAAVHKDNIFGVQFHPEKSQDVGLKIIRNFLEL